MGPVVEADDGGEFHLVGLAVHAPRNAVDKIVKDSQLHP
jgi:hypothetical protein